MRLLCDGSATHIWGNKIVGIATGILTLLILIFGEITPKTVATIQAERIAFRFAKIIYYIMTVLTPVIFVVNQLSFLVLKLLRVDVKAKGESITEDELRTIVEVSHEEGVIESEEKKMINNVFDFGDAVARDVMLPKVNMTFVDVDATYDELMEVFRSEKYTRYPVYEETTDNVIGVLNIKDIFLKGGEEGFFCPEISAETSIHSEFKKVAELMREMRESSDQHRDRARRVRFDGRSYHAGRYAGGDCRRYPGRVRWRRGKIHSAHRPARIHGRWFGQTRRSG